MVYSDTEGRCVDFSYLYDCLASPSMDAYLLTAPALTLLYFWRRRQLGTAFVWMLWEVGATSQPHRNSGLVRIGALRCWVARTETRRAAARPYANGGLVPVSQQRCFS